MKRLGMFLLMCMPLACKAQLQANAGRDTAWCVSSISNPPRLAPAIGGQLAATGGIPPYKYLWTVLDPTYPTRVYLDDVHSPSPVLIYPAPGGIDSLNFVLKVTDAGSVAPAYDTVTVFFSKWGCTGLICEQLKGLNDTIHLRGNCSGNLKPMTYLWSPGTYLSDSTAEVPACWSPVEQVYKLTVTNSKGCSVDGGRCLVSVWSTGINAAAPFIDKFSISPNPLVHESNLSCGTYWRGGNIMILCADGRLVGYLPIRGAETSLRPIIPEAGGFYIYKISNSAGDTRYGRLIR